MSREGAILWSKMIGANLDIAMHEVALPIILRKTELPMLVQR